MSPNIHSGSNLPFAKKLKTPLKASIVLLTSMILASCAIDGDTGATGATGATGMPGAK